MLITLMVFAGAPAMRAQADRGPEVKIGKVEVRFLGVRNVSEQVVRANVQLREGAVYDESSLDRDVRNLYHTGLFELIEVKKDETSPLVVNCSADDLALYLVLGVLCEVRRYGVPW